MSALTVNSVMSHGDVKDSFDQKFVSSFLKKIPKILNLKEDELSLGQIASITEQPRSTVGRFLLAASNMKDFPIGLVNRNPVIKKTDSTKQKTKKTTAKQTSAKTFNITNVAKMIVDALMQEPIDSSFDKRYASVETLSDELDVPEDFVSKVIDNLRKRNVVSLYEGENDFDEVVFYLNKDAFNKVTADVKKSEPKKKVVETKKVASPTKKESAPKKVIEPTTPNEVEIDWINMHVPKRTRDAVIDVMKESKYTRNGILKEVAQKGVHQRNHVEAAFKQLIEEGTAQPTNDGGAREYYAIIDEESNNAPEVQAQEEVKAEKSVAPVEDIKQEDVTVPEKVKVSSKPISSGSVDDAILNSLSMLLGNISENISEGIKDSSDIDNMLAKLKSAEHMLLAAKSLR